MWVQAQDVRVNDFLVAEEETVSLFIKTDDYVRFNKIYLYQPDEVVDINPIYKVTGVGTYRMFPNLTKADIQKFVDEGLEVRRVD